MLTIYEFLWQRKRIRNSQKRGRIVRIIGTVHHSHGQTPHRQNQSDKTEFSCDLYHGQIWTNLTESPCLFQLEVKFVSFKHRFHYVITNKLCQQMFGGASGKMRQAAVTVQ